MPDKPRPKRPSALVPIIAGFGVMVLLLLSVTAIGFTHIRAISKQLTAIVAERNQKAEIASQLSALHEARHQCLRLATQLDDAFERDDELMKFAAMARTFIQLRDRFLALPLDAAELDIWNRIRGEVRQVEASADHIQELLQREQARAAQALIARELAPRHAEMMAGWGQLADMQHALNLRAVSEATTLRDRALNLTLALSAAVITVGALVALFVIRLSRRLETDLFEEKELAQVTLGAITDAVIRFDTRPSIALLNPAAERLLGLTLAEAADLPCHEALLLLDRRDGSVITATLQQQVLQGDAYTLPPGTRLRTLRGKEHTVKGQCSPIHTSEGDIVGGVLVLRVAEPGPEGETA